jgi:hypothetical protein
MAKKAVLVPFTASESGTGGFVIYDDVARKKSYGFWGWSEDIEFISMSSGGLVPPEHSRLRHL